MGRSGYTEDWDCDNYWGFIRYRGAVKAAFRGKRGQSFLLEMLAALDALPEKKLVARELETDDGCVCALGAVGKRRGGDLNKIDPDDIETVAGAFGIADAMAKEIVYENDEGGFHDETPERRFERVRNWVMSEIRDVELSKAITTG